MPIQKEDNKYYDFEEIFFEKDCDIDNIINSFFNKYKKIKKNKKYVTYEIKKLIETDRQNLNGLNGEGQDPLNRIGKVSYFRHNVIPEKNNGKEYYIYCINSFI